MSETLNKLNRIFEFAGMIAKILMVLIVVVAAIVVVFMAVLAFFPDILTKAVEAVPGTVLPTSDQLYTLSAAAVLNMVFLFVLLYYLYRLSKNISESRTPFTDASVRYLELMAVILFISTFALPAISALVSFAYGIWPYGVISFSPYLLLTSIIVYFLSLIFKYGTSLQKESDETL